MRLRNSLPPRAAGYSSKNLMNAQVTSRNVPPTPGGAGNLVAAFALVSWASSLVGLFDSGTDAQVLVLLLMVPLNALLSAIVANVDLAPRADEPREWSLPSCVAPRLPVAEPVYSADAVYDQVRESTVLAVENAKHAVGMT